MSEEVALDIRWSARSSWRLGGVPTVMRRQAPQQRGLLAAEEAPQLAQHLN